MAGWMDEGDDFALVPPADPKIGNIDRYDAMVRMQLAEPDEAEIGQIGFRWAYRSANRRRRSSSAWALNAGITRSSRTMANGIAEFCR